MLLKVRYFSFANWQNLGLVPFASTVCLVNFVISQLNIVFFIYQILTILEQILCLIFLTYIIFVVKLTRTVRHLRRRVGWRGPDAPNAGCGSSRRFLPESCREHRWTLVYARNGMREWKGKNAQGRRQGSVVVHHPDSPPGELGSALLVGLQPRLHHVVEALVGRQGLEHAPDRDHQPAQEVQVVVPEAQAVQDVRHRVQQRGVPVQADQVAHLSLPRGVEGDPLNLRPELGAELPEQRAADDQALVAVQVRAEGPVADEVRASRPRTGLADPHHQVALVVVQLHALRARRVEGGEAEVAGDHRRVGLARAALLTPGAARPAGEDAEAAALVGPAAAEPAPLLAPQARVAEELGVGVSVEGGQVAAQRSVDAGLAERPRAVPVAVDDLHVSAAGSAEPEVHCGVWNFATRPAPGAWAGNQRDHGRVLAAGPGVSLHFLLGGLPRGYRAVLATAETADVLSYVINSALQLIMSQKREAHPAEGAGPLQPTRRRKWRTVLVNFTTNIIQVKKIKHKIYSSIVRI
ncbi:Transmembrane domain-containing protein [Spironucleus salmonicida]|uniref:Transmembrane domain-containing protein n=1 Tax=Spironucleus salmonicida TaxID=348837 RepID=A0A9P8RZP4_9EUKA|nr:Transmembrane domain-containing protein [Spironucleus salmonicida]